MIITAESQTAKLRPRLQPTGHTGDSYPCDLGLSLAYQAGIQPRSHRRQSSHPLTPPRNHAGLGTPMSSSSRKGLLLEFQPPTTSVFAPLPSPIPFPPRLPLALKPRKDVRLGVEHDLVQRQVVRRREEQVQVLERLGLASRGTVSIS
jgi:hypothetical protein